MADAGWYPDPEGSGWRWWDGASWAAPLPQQPSPPRTRSKDPFGIADAPWAAGVSRLVAIAAGCGAVVAATIAVLTVVLGRAIPGAWLLLLPAIPLLLLGQLWSLGLIAAHSSASADPTAPWWRRSVLRLADLRGGLSRPVALLFVGLFYAVVIATMFSSAGSGPPGSPARDVGGCPYAVVNHGDVTCVSESAHRAAGSLGQRFAALVLCGFFIGHCGIALGEVTRRGGTPPGTRPGSAGARWRRR
jgi:Protein of unknown function (DUF2510)